MANISNNSVARDAQQYNTVVKVTLKEETNYHKTRTEKEKQEDLRIALLRTNSISNRARIITRRGSVVPGTCEWIDKIPTFELWCKGLTPFLWIYGDAGKGKTFLSISIIDKLCEMPGNPSTALVLEYFCNNNDNQRNTAHAVLTDLLRQLLDLGEQPDNFSHLYNDVLREFECWGVDLFSEKHREELWGIFSKMIGRVQKPIYFVLDGLDECDKTSIEFLRAKFKAMYSASDSKGDQYIRTLIVSRPSVDIRGTATIGLREHTQKTEQDLEIFIKSHVAQVTGLKDETKRNDRKQLCKILLDRAEGTFLWVALAIDILDEDKVDKILKSKDDADILLPRGLSVMIDRLLLGVLEGEDEDKTGTKREDAIKIIRWVSLAFRPLTVAELRAATGVNSLDSIRKCRHVLSLPKDVIQDDTELQLVHLSLKEYLLRPTLVFPASVGLLLRPYLLGTMGCVRRQTYLLSFLDYIIFVTILLQARDLLLWNLALAFFIIIVCSIILWVNKGSPILLSLLVAFEQSLKLCIFAISKEKAHRDIYERCLELMETHLKKDVYEFQRPGADANEAKNLPLPPALLAVKYACCYWVDHFHEAKICSYDKVQVFLNKQFLHWLEALGWIGKTSEGILAITSLESMVRAKESPSFHEFIHDAKRFALHNRYMIEQAPLQLYCSALVFAPKTSIIRRNFEECIPIWIQRKPEVQAQWSVMLQTLEGHTDTVASVAFSPSGKQVVSGSWDHTVRLWSTVTGRQILVLKSHADRVASVAFSPNGKQVVSGSWDHTVRLWSTVTGRQILVLKGHTDRVASVAFSPNGKRVVSGSWDHTVRLWDIATGKQVLALKGHAKWVNSVAFSPNGKKIASASDDQTIKLWDTKTGDFLKTLAGHSKSVNTVAFSPDSEWVVVGSDDNTIRFWDIATGKQVLPAFDHSSSVNSVAFSPDGKHVVSGGIYTIRLWNTAIEKQDLPVFEGHTRSVRSVAFSPDGKQVVSGGDHTIRLWNTAIEKQILPTLDNYTKSVISVAFSPDGKQIASTSQENIIRLWDTATGKQILPVLKGHTNSVSSIAFSPNSKQIVSGSRDNTIRLWDTATGKQILPALEGHTSWVNSIAFSFDGKQIVSGSGDNTIRLWDIATGKQVFPAFEGHTRPVILVAFSPNNKQVISGSADKTIRLWDIATEKQVLPVFEGHTESITSLAFSPDGKQVVSGSWDNIIRLWDITMGKQILLIPTNHTMFISSVAFSPNSKQVISKSFDNTIRFWDTTTGKRVLPTLEDYTESVITSIAFSSDNTANTLLVSNPWIIEGNKNILWLPSDYRLNCSDIWNRILVFGHLSGRISILELREGPKFI